MSLLGISETPSEPPISHDFYPVVQKVEFEIAPPQVDEVVVPIAKEVAPEPVEQGGTTTPPTKRECSCVAWVRARSSFQPPRVVSAKDIPILYTFPRVGSLVVFGAGGIYGRHGHVGIVTAVNGDTFDIKEFNLKPCKETTRTIRVDDPLLLGFFDTRHW